MRPGKNEEKRKKGLRGFTLVELLVVLLIIGILVAIAAPSYFSTIGQSKSTTFCANIDQIKKAIQAYAVQNNGVYPTTASAMSTAVFNGTYLSPSTSDPYGGTMQFHLKESGPLSTGDWTYIGSADGSWFTITASPACPQ